MDVWDERERLRASGANVIIVRRVMEEAFLFCVVFAVGSLFKEWSERRIERRARRGKRI